MFPFLRREEPEPPEREAAQPDLVRRVQAYSSQPFGRQRDEPRFERADQPREPRSPAG